MESDRRRWNERHDRGQLSDARPPDAITSAGLESMVPEDGALLDVACGTGPVARWAARRGLRVVALDVSDVAIDRLVRSTDGDGVDARRVDLDDGLPPELGTFDVVVCQRFRDPDVLRSLPDLVHPGGMLVVTVLSEVGSAAPGPFHAPAGELTRFAATECADWDRLVDDERNGEASLVLRRPEETVATEVPA